MAAKPTMLGLISVLCFYSSLKEAERKRMLAFLDDLRKTTGKAKLAQTRKLWRKHNLPEKWPEIQPKQRTGAKAKTAA